MTAAAANYDDVVEGVGSRDDAKFDHPVQGAVSFSEGVQRKCSDILSSYDKTSDVLFHKGKNGDSD